MVYFTSKDESPGGNFKDTMNGSMFSIVYSDKSSTVGAKMSDWNVGLLAPENGAVAVKRKHELPFAFVTVETSKVVGTP